MVYIQLATPIRDFGKVRVKQISFFDNDGVDNIPKALGFRYQVFKNSGNSVVSLYEKFVNIGNEDFIESITDANDPNLTAYEFICKKLLQYLINESIEIGTIERQ